MKSRFITTNDSNYPWDALHLFAENSAVNRHNQLMLNSIPTDVTIITAIDIIPESLSDRDLGKIKVMKQSDTGGLAYEVAIKIGARVMLVANIDIEDRLINGQLGSVVHFRLRNERVEMIYVKFDDEKAGLKLQSRDRYASSSQSVPIERSEATFSLNKGKGSFIKRTQFPLILSYACTVHKVQGLTLDRAVISFDLEKQRSFNPGQMYVALSRVKSIDGLYFTGQYSHSAFTCSKKVADEYTRLRMTENQLAPLKDFQISNTSLVISLLNIRSLKLHSIDILSDKFLLGSDILCLTETQIGFDNNDSHIHEIEENLNVFTISFNNDQHKHNSLALCHQEDVNVLEYDHSSAFSLMTFKKDSFCNKEFCLLLLYKSPKIQFNVFLCQLSNFLRTYQIDFVLGDFNINGLDETACSRLNEIMTEYQLVLDFPTHIDGGMLDHIYVLNKLARDFDVKTLRKCVNMSDHDAIKIKLLPRETDSDIDEE